jgi:hypothetical protein
MPAGLAIMGYSTRFDEVDCEIMSQQGLPTPLSLHITSQCNQRNQPR